MRTSQQIQIDIDQEMLNIKKAESRLEELKKEKFHSEYYIVDWNDAEKHFIENLDVEDSWIHGPEVNDGSEYYRRSNLSIEMNGDSPQMWVGGYERHDIFKRGLPFYIERKYEGLISEFKDA